MPARRKCWLPELEVGGHGPEWLTQVFAKMGTDPSDAAYKKPTQGGVWRFIQRVAVWVADPRRKGMRAEHVPLDHLLAPPEPAEEPAAEEKREKSKEKEPSRKHGAEPEAAVA